MNAKKAELEASNGWTCAVVNEKWTYVPPGPGHASYLGLGVTFECA